MYIPPRYRVTDDATIDAFLRENGFATLVTSGPAGLMATHIPVELGYAPDATRLLQGHVSRGNPQWRELEAGADAMVVFLGPHTYVSPTWYSEPNVPTWNYQAAHAYGPVRMVLSRDELLPQLRALAEHYEPPSLQGPRFDMAALPEKQREAELRGLVAFEMRVTRIEAAFKLSQNRSAFDHERITRELAARGDDASRAIARAMAGEGAPGQVPAGGPGGGEAA